MRSVLIFLLSLAFAGQAAAQASSMPPEDGIWGDPAQSGSGFVIETNNRIMAVAAFAYNEGRQSTWYLGTAPYDYTNHRWTGTVASTTGGQCLGCTHSTPTTSPTSTNLEIRFTSQTTATVLVNGVQRYAIQRTYFDAPTIDNFVLGEWYFSYPATPNSGVLTGDDLLLVREATCTSGPCSQGFRFGDLRPVTGSRGAGGTYSVLLDSSTDFWTLYLVFPYKNEMRGSVFVFRKGTEPSQSAEIPGVRALRVATRAGLTAQGVTKAATPQAIADANATLEALWQRQVAAKGDAPSTAMMSDAELDALAKALGAY